MRSGSQMIHGKAVIENQASEEGTVAVGDVNIALHSGYPIGQWNAAIRYIVGLDDVDFSGASDVCTLDWCGRGNQQQVPSGKATQTGLIGKVYPKGYSWNDQCGVYYVNHADGRAPEIGLETKDC